MAKDRLEHLKAGRNTKGRKTSLHEKKTSEPIEVDENEENETAALTGPKIQTAVVRSKSKEKNNLDKAYKHVNSINEYLAQIHEDIVQLKRYHVRMQQSTRTDASLREQIDSLNQIIKATSMKIKTALKDLEKEKKGEEDKVIFRVVKTQHSLLSKHFKETMLDYENTLSAHKKICEDLIKRQLHIVIEKFLLRKVTCVPAERQVTDEELSAMLESEDTAVFVDNYTKETLQARQSLEDARDRHKEILAIEKDIALVRDMFFDIALHVSQQGELIDRIEYHIGNGCVLAEKGTKRLGKAEKFALEARKKKCCLIVCLSSVIGVLLIIMAIQMFLTPG